MKRRETYLDDKMVFVGLFETYPNADAYTRPSRSSCDFVTR